MNLPLQFDECSEPREPAKGFVIAQPSHQFVWRDAGDLVASPVEAENRAISQVFSVFRVDLVKISVGGREAPTRIKLPFCGKLHPAMFRARRVERVADAGQRRRLADEFISEELIEAGCA